MNFKQIKFGRSLVILLDWTFDRLALHSFIFWEWLACTLRDCHGSLLPHPDQLHCCWDSQGRNLCASGFTVEVFAVISECLLMIEFLGLQSLEVLDYLVASFLCSRDWNCTDWIQEEIIHCYGQVEQLVEFPTLHQVASLYLAGQLIDFKVGQRPPFHSPASCIFSSCLAISSQDSFHSYDRWHRRCARFCLGLLVLGHLAEESEHQEQPGWWERDEHVA